MACSIMDTSKCKIWNSDIQMATGYIELESRKEVVVREKTEKHKLLVNIWYVGHPICDLKGVMTHRLKITDLDIQ